LLIGRSTLRTATPRGGSQDASAFGYIWNYWL
jgi:hypothetical protein